MGDNMDNTKNVALGVFAVLFLTVGVSAVDVGYNQQELDFSNLSMNSVGFVLKDGEPVNVNLRSYGTNLYSFPLVARVMPYPSTTAPGSASTFFVDCDNTQYDEVTYTLSNYDNWADASWFMLNLMSTYLGAVNQTVVSSVNEEAFIISGLNCTFVASGQDMFINFYSELPETTLFSQTATLESVLAQKYAVPDEAMASMVNGMKRLITSAFLLGEMILMVSGVMIFFFIFVFLWKFIEYFVSRIKKKRAIE